MGNKCCKAKVTDSVEAQLEPRNSRRRLFRVLGCGKFVASVAVNDGLNKRTEEIAEPKDIEATSKLFLRLSISDLVRRNRDAFFSTSSLVDMLNNDTDYYNRDKPEKKISEHSWRQEQDSQKREFIDVNLSTTTVICGSHTESSTNNEDKQYQQTNKEETEALVDTKQVENQCCSTLDEDGEEKVEYARPDAHQHVDKPETDAVEDSVNDSKCESNLQVTDILANDDINKDDEYLETAPNKELVMKTPKNDVFILTRECVFQNRPLSPEFFSAPQDNLYADFGGDDTFGEVEEEIIFEKGEDNQESVEHGSLCANDNDKKMLFGKGEVSLNLEDIQAAMSRLGYLNEGLDPLMERNELNNKTSDVNSPVVLEEEYQYESEIKQSSQKLGNELQERIDTIPKIIVSSYESGEEQKTKTYDSTDIQSSTIYISDIEKRDACQKKLLYSSTLRKSDCLPSTNIDHLVNGVISSASEPTVEVERTHEQEDETKSLPILSETVDQCSSLSPTKSNISIATASSLEILKSHNSRSDCMMSVYVRSSISNEEPRKIDIRATSKQVKDGTAAKHVKLLEDIHLPPKLHGPISAKSRSIKEHLYKTPSVAKHEDDRKEKWIQTKGLKNLTHPNKVPTFHESTEKTQNSRERLGLERLQKYKIRVQCKAIERIKIDADEFPGILPPKIRYKYRQKVDEKRHMN